LGDRSDTEKEGVSIGVSIAAWAKAKEQDLAEKGQWRERKRRVWHVKDKTRRLEVYQEKRKTAAALRHAGGTGEKKPRRDRFPRTGNPRGQSLSKRIQGWAKRAPSSYKVRGESNIQSRKTYQGTL